MLSYEERRRLSAIEKQLAIDDPALARRFARHRSAVQQRRRVAAMVLGSLCAFALIVGFLPLVVTLCLLAAAPFVVAGYVVLRRAERRNR
ncbi:MAG TPA: DUF3040 domain-containing protein [Pseudonocardia sp.]